MMASTILFFCFFLFSFIILISSYFISKELIIWKIKKEALKHNLIITKVLPSNEKLELKNTSNKIITLIKKHTLIDYGFSIEQIITKEIYYYFKTDDSKTIHTKLIIIKVLFFYRYNVYINF